MVWCDVADTENKEIIMHLLVKKERRVAIEENNERQMNYINKTQKYF